MDKIIRRLEKFQNSLENSMLHLESYTSKGLFNTNVLYAARGQKLQYWWDGKITVDGSRVLDWMPMSELDSIEIK